MLLRIRLADGADYLGAVFVADDAIRKLDAVRTRASDSEQALERLRELRGYFETGDHVCFLDYIGLRNLEESYAETHQEVISLLDRAEKEIRDTSPGPGIDDAIAFAEDFAEVCLLEGLQLGLN